MSEEDFDTIIEEYEQALANMQREYDKRGDRIEELEAACWRMQEERDRAIGWRDSDKDRADKAEAKLAQAVKLIELAVELAQWNLNPKLRDDMVDFTTTVKGEQP